MISNVPIDHAESSAILEVKLESAIEMVHVYIPFQISNPWNAIKVCSILSVKMTIKLSSE